MKKLAVMQPYIFPYLGYFHLINAVDNFIFFDDVTYIKKGWINRNRILLNNDAWLFTIPIKNASQNTQIKDLLIADNIEVWKKKFFNTICRAYKKSPFFDDVYYIVNKCLSHNSNYFIDWLTDSTIFLANVLSMTTVFDCSSVNGNPVELKGQDRIIDISIRENATTYINPINGQSLYDKAIFKKNGIDLYFIKSKYSYKQFKEPFIEHLSIIDVLMFNDIESIKKMLNHYELI